MRKITLFAAVLFSVAVRAGTLDGLGSEMETAKSELPGLNSTMSQATEANISLKKEYDVYAKDQEEKKAALATALANVERTVKQPAEQKYANELASYTARCNRTFNRETEMSQYNQCIAEKSQVDQDRASLNQWWKNYAAEWNRQNVDPVNAVILKQNARMNQITGLIKANFERFTQAQDRSLALRARIKAITAKMKTYCSSQTPPAGANFTYNEWLKWCGNVDWDGVNKNLVPMYRYQGTGGAAPN